MPSDPLASRYDEFQEEAVVCLHADFSKNPHGRYLLVIPTGGGKTYTAVKAINRLFETGVFAPTDKVLWMAHRTELVHQAEDTFKRFEEQNSDKSFRSQVVIK